MLYEHLNRDALSYISNAGTLYVNYANIGHNLLVNENGRVKGGFIVDGDTALNKNLEVKGNMIFGDASTDSINFKAAAITLSSGNTKFTNLKSLWGTIS